jgi:predicted TIM-barrel fold metal-dependent hydrolase
MRPMKRPITRVIALEEAFLHPALKARYPPDYVRLLAHVQGGLTDVGPERIRRMDAAGIDLQVLSHVAPGVQTLDTASAVHLSAEINDWLAGVVAEHPARFAGFAMLPTQAPATAAEELERTVSQLGFKGALINGHTHGRYLDDELFWPILERAQALNVPIYIHPGDPPQAIMQTYYAPYPALAQSWGWQVETGTHLLRLMCAGVFDRFPRLKIIVGHMGELLPYALDRINRGVTLGSWLLAAQSNEHTVRPREMRKSIRYYMRHNVCITTSGVFDQVALRCAVDQLGIDNILFSVDDPFGDNFEAVSFLNSAPLSDEDREKLAHLNAERVLNLSAATASHGRAQRGIRSALAAFTAQSKAKVARAALSFLLK